MQSDDEPQAIESKFSDPARARSTQDSEGQIAKLGSEALEPRRVSVPLPGSEVQAMTCRTVYQLHVKHYHTLPTHFRRRNSMVLFIKSTKMWVTSVFV